MRCGSPASLARFQSRNRERPPSWPALAGASLLPSIDVKEHRMRAKPKSDRRTNVLRGRPIEGRISERCHAPAETAYDLLADLPRHLEWGGTRRRKRSRLLSIEAQAGAALVGTEFTSTGRDSMCLMTDRSVVTEAAPSRTLEFVTESWCSFKRSGKRVDWTIVHRYDIEPDPAGCRIIYTHRATRATSLPGRLAIFRIPVLRSIAVRTSMAELRGGLRNLARMAEGGR